MSDEVKLVFNSAPLDFELAKLLGRPYSDFIVLCANREPIPFTGTPYDSTEARLQYQQLVERLNKRGRGSFWPEFFRSWEREFHKHYKLPPDATPKQFHPTFSFQISRVCPGYSQYLHAGVQLLEKLQERKLVKRWWLYAGICNASSAIIKDWKGASYEENGPKLSENIARAVIRLLVANPIKPNAN